MTEKERKPYREKAVDALTRSGIMLTAIERQNVEIADFHLGMFEKVGLAILTYVNTRRVCAKELVLLPGQICPEHRHPSTSDAPGKEETFRCRQGKVILYVPGEPDRMSVVDAPAMETALTVFHRIELNPGDQYTLPPDTLHWFKAGSEGAIVSEFSTRSTDERDVFTDSRIIRV